VLILGSFPSVKSREEGFFYGHPQNRFWKVLSRIFETKVPQTTAEKKKLIEENGLALWDVIHSCEITGSADSSIKKVVPNDLSNILAAAPIDTIITNGKTADNLYRKYLEKETGIPAVCLPSTSPANARWTEDKLYEKWKKTINELLSPPVLKDVKPHFHLFAQ